MHRARPLLVLLIVGAALVFLHAQGAPPQGAATIAPPSLPAPLSSLRMTHPRLYVLDEDVARVRGLIASDSGVRSWRDRLQQRAAAMLQEPVVERVLVGPRLLAQSRLALKRVSTLAGLYRLDGDSAKLERAKAEMLAAAAFSDWNPSHFLDVAEMTNALAIGYDWLYPFLTAAERATIRQAIVDKGLRPGLRAYDERAWWAVEGRNNWTQVCNGGLVAGALAVAEDEPEIAARLISLAHGEGMQRRMRLYAPDGGDEEGPGYWDYATAYTAFYLSGLKTAIDTDFGISDVEGFADTGQFRMQSIGPTGQTFNYADAREDAGGAPQMFWLAGRFQKPEYAAHERARLARSETAPDIFHLLWAAHIPAGDATPPPTAARFQSIGVALLRGDWRDPQTSWVGFKGGRNTASHGHLDLGSFVFEARGERWAIDLGPDDYDLPGYFGARRWSYFRLRTESHNTLLINGRNQDPAASAPLTGFGSDGYRAFAIADLTAAYAPDVIRARRGIQLIDGRDLLTQDEIEAGQPIAAVWQMLTRADVTTDGRDAVLRRHGQSLALRVLEPPGARLFVEAASAPPPQAAQPDVHVLRLVVPRQVTSTRFVVWLSPGDRPAPAVVPLDEWR